MPIARTSKPKRFVPEKREGAPEGPGQQDLVDELVLFSPVESFPDYVTKAGDKSHKTIVSLQVLTGEHKGYSQDDYFLFGNLAAQAAEVPVGEFAAARIIKGRSKRGYKFYGLDFDLDESDEALADAAL